MGSIGIEVQKTEFCPFLVLNRMNLRYAITKTSLNALINYFSKFFQTIFFILTTNINHNNFKNFFLFSIVRWFLQIFKKCVSTGGSLLYDSPVKGISSWFLSSISIVEHWKQLNKLFDFLEAAQSLLDPCNSNTWKKHILLVICALMFIMGKICMYIKSYI